MNYILGVDPGARGGIALLDQSSQVIAYIGLRPDMTEQEITREILDCLPSLGQKVVCFFEKVGYMRGDGGKGAFTFGKVTGFLRGILRSRGIEIRDVYPAVWQSRLNCLSRGNKNVTKRKAQELFPTIRITHAIADALLIAEYGIRVFLEP